MSYSHNLSIQGVTATLKMSLENSIVSYKLSLRSASGEEVNTEGKLPQESLDAFVVINQHFNVPQAITPSSAPECTFKIQPNGLDLINQAYPSSDVLIEVDSFSSVPATSPRRLIDDLPPLVADDSTEEELQACTAEVTEVKRASEASEALQVELAHPLEPVQSANELPTQEDTLMLKLTNILMFSKFNIKKRALFTVKDYITENNIVVQDNQALCELMIRVSKHLINRYVYDTELVDRCSEMACLTGESQESISQLIIRRVNQYGLFRNVARKLGIDVPQDTINEWYSRYAEWKEEGNGADLNRWKAMEHWLLHCRLPVVE